MLSGRGFDIVRRGRGFVAMAVFAVALVWPSLAAADFTWTGAAADPNWSDGTNWGGTAPSGSVGTLSFPALSGCSTCYSSSNDVSGLSVNAISIEDGVPYQVTGTGLTLGAGGLTTTSSAAGSSANIGLPLTLGAAQTWSIGGGGSSGQQLGVSSVSGAQSLTVDLSNAGILSVGHAEVGSVGISGSGVVGVYGSLNGTDGSPVSLINSASLAALAAGAKVGPLTSTAGSIQVGGGHPDDGTLAATGAVTLNPTSNLTMFIDQTGITPSTDFSQLTATGAVNLGGASLFLDGPGTGCPALHVGDVYPLVKTTGALTGTFNGVANGTNISLSCSGGTGTVPMLKINYTGHAATATVVSAAGGGTTTGLTVGPSPAVTNQIVTLTATVAPTSPAPAGTVEFDNGGAPIPGCGAVTLDTTTFKATCHPSFAAAASPQSLSATFTSTASGVSGSTSSVVNLVVNKNTTAMSLGVAPPTVAVGATENYVATVASNPNSPVQPTGTVQFYDNGTPILDCAGQGQLVAGNATCTLSYPAPGTHNITASYPGDVNFTGSPQTTPVTVMVVEPPPTALSAPTISGDTTQGQTLSETHGMWTPSPFGYSYQWLDCDSVGNNCAPIPGATNQTYTLTANDVGHTIRVQEGAATQGGPGSPVTSVATAVVQPPSAAPTAPVSSAPPVITGVPVVGRTLSTSNGLWSGTPPSSYSYQWQRCSSSGCTNIPGATGTIYALGNADLGMKIRVVVVAVNEVGAGIAMSDQVGPVFGRAQIKAALGKEIKPKGGSAKIGAILKAGSYKLSFTAPTSGHVVITWFQAGKPLVVAIGRATFGSAGTKRIKIKLTAPGKKLLAHAGQLKVSAKEEFTPDGQASIIARATFTLKR